MNLMCTDVYNKGVQAGEIAAAQLAEVGIKCNLVVVDRATFSAAWNGLTPRRIPRLGHVPDGRRLHHAGRRRGSEAPLRY